MRKVKIVLLIRKNKEQVGDSTSSVLICLFIFEISTFLGDQ